MAEVPSLKATDLPSTVDEASRLEIRYDSTEWCHFSMSIWKIFGQYFGYTEDWSHCGEFGFNLKEFKLSAVVVFHGYLHLRGRAASDLRSRIGLDTAPSHVHGRELPLRFVQ